MKESAHCIFVTGVLAFIVAFQGSLINGENSCVTLEPCLAGETCVPDADGGQSYRCIAADPCATVTCQNGGSCYQLIRGIGACRCTSAYRGTFCEKLAPDSCDASSPCSRGYSCVSGGPGNYTYQCVASSPCASFECANGGICLVRNWTATCQCADGYTGLHCEQLAPTACDLYSPCSTGATCSAGPPGVLEYTCQTPDVCISFSCLNGGTCQTSFSGQAECVCTDAFTGKHCEESVPDACDFLEPCLDQFMCISGPTGTWSYICIPVNTVPASTSSTLPIAPTPTTTSMSVTAQPVADCSDIVRNGFITDGVYNITLINGQTISVYCDMTTDGGGWTTFQRRYNSSFDFSGYNNWAYYKNGFGNIDGEHWLGNENTYLLTNVPGRPMQLRLDMVFCQPPPVYFVSLYEIYNSFWLDNESDGYKFHVNISSATGNAGDGLGTFYNNPINGMKFTTADRDNDNNNGNCAADYGYGCGWWYDSCYSTNLNINRGPSVEMPFCTAGVYSSFVLHYSTMKMRPMSFN